MLSGLAKTSIGRSTANFSSYWTLIGLFLESHTHISPISIFYSFIFLTYLHCTKRIIQWTKIIHILKEECPFSVPTSLCQKIVYGFTAKKFHRDLFSIVFQKYAFRVRINVIFIVIFIIFIFTHWKTLPPHTPHTSHTSAHSVYNVSGDTNQLDVSACAFILGFARMVEAPKLLFFSSGDDPTYFRD